MKNRRARLRGEAPPGPDDPPASEDAPGSDDKPGSALDDHEPNRAAAEASCAAAAEAYKASAGSDSAAALMHAEEMGSAAAEAIKAAEGSSMKLRGAAPAPEDAKPAAPPMPPAPGARAIVAAAGGSSAAAHLEAAQLVALGRDVMARTGATSPDAAMLQLEAALGALSEVKAIRAKDAAAKIKTEAAAKVSRLEAAVRAGMPRAQAFTVAEVGGKEVLTPKASWLRGSLADLDATLNDLGWKAGASVKPGFNLPADGEAGLAARALASGMSVEERRAAEANQARSAARENSR